MKSLKIFVGILILQSLAGCGDRREKVADDKYVVELSGHTTAIVDDKGNFVVYPNVADWIVSDEFLIGLREPATSNAFDLNEFSQGMGYFVLNLESSKLEQGLSTEACEAHSICEFIL